jgi:hypothetical protein
MSKNLVFILDARLDTAHCAHCVAIQVDIHLKIDYSFHCSDLTVCGNAVWLLRLKGTDRSAFLRSKGHYIFSRKRRLRLRLRQLLRKTLKKVR